MPPQERADDVVAYTEARINAIKVDVSKGGIPLVPFVRVSYDTEFTATPNPTADDPTAKFPHQKIGRLQAGAVLYPGAVLLETRVAPVFQIDFSEDETRNDFGAELSYKLRWPIYEGLTFESDSQLLYLVPDGDDRDTDLAVRIGSQNKLLVPIGSLFSMFGFADLFYGVGKTDANNDIGGSAIVGGGFRFATTLKSRSW